jgi:hypothetical protein
VPINHDKPRLVQGELLGLSKCETLHQSASRGDQGLVRSDLTSATEVETYVEGDVQHANNDKHSDHVEDAHEDVVQSSYSAVDVPLSQEGALSYISKTPPHEPCC